MPNRPAALLERESCGAAWTMETVGMYGLGAGIKGALNGLDFVVVAEEIVVVFFEEVVGF